jgi:sulfur carrier protein ThiS
VTVVALEADPPHLGDIGDPTVQPLGDDAGPVVDRQEERVLEAVEDAREAGDEEEAAGGASHGVRGPAPSQGAQGPGTDEVQIDMEAETTNGRKQTTSENGHREPERFRFGRSGGFRVRGGRVEGEPGPELVEKLCEARANMEGVERNGYNDHLDHEYATYDDVMRAVAKPLAEAGVWCLESVVDTLKQEAGNSRSGRSQHIVTLVLETVWTDGESSFRSYWIGEALDSGDKHHYQLLSQVTKYAYAKTLKLDTGDRGVDATHHETHAETEPDEPSSNGGGREPATDCQQAYIRNLQEKCLARGADEGEHEVLQVAATGKQAASDQIERLQVLETELAGAGADEYAGGEVVPEWATARIREAEESHPGRHEGAVGISTLTYNPKLTARILEGEDVEGPSGSRLAKGTFLHEKLYGEAPHRELEVRAPVDGTDLFFEGHVDAVDPELEAVRDLKTTDRWDLSDERLEQVRRQLGLYGYCLLEGEVNVGTHEAPDWVPAQDYLGFAVDRALVDLWPAGDIQWGRVDVDGSTFSELVESTEAWATSQVRDMVAGQWSPPEPVQEHRETPEAPEDVREAVQEAGRLSEVVDEAAEQKDELRDRIYEAVDETVRAGPYQALHTGPSTRETLNMDRAEVELDEADHALEDFQYGEMRVDVVDEAKLALKLEELGIPDEEAGVEVEEVPVLAEERLRQRLAEVDVLEDCLEEEVTRSGYVSVRRKGGA